MNARCRRFFSLLAPAVGMVLVAVVGVAPRAEAATVDGPYAPGTTTNDTDQGHTVEWKVTEVNPCGPGVFWAVVNDPDDIGLSDIAASPVAATGPVSTTITATITGDIGSTAQLNFSLLFSGFILDPVHGSIPCAHIFDFQDTFTVTDPLAPDVMPTTASLAYKRSLPGFTGKLAAENGCAAERKVQLFKQDAGPDTKLDTKTSSATGGYKFKGRAKNGKYYVKAPKDDRGAVVCGAAKSSNVTVG